MQRLLLLVLTMAAAGCAAKTPLYRPVAEAVAREEHPLAVELRSGERVVLRNPYVQRDSVIGIVDRTSTERRIAVADVASITRTERELHPLGLGAASLGAGVLAGAVLLVIIALTGS